MIKIYPSGKGDDRPKVQRKSSNVSVGSGTTFKTQLESVLGHEFEGSIDALMNELREQEHRFVNLPNLHEMNRYRSLIQKILKEIGNESFSIKELSVKSRHNAKIYTVVETVNDKLLELSSAITKGSPAFALMKTMEEIRGLILDLLQ